MTAERLLIVYEIIKILVIIIVFFITYYKIRQRLNLMNFYKIG